MMLKGRRKIVSEFTSEQLKDVNNVMKMVNSTRPIHLLNKTEIDYLVEYKNGLQPVLFKEKVIRDEINNKIVYNHAQMITRNIIGYFLGTPIQYIQAGGTTSKTQLEMLNRFVQFEDKASTDQQIGEYQSICGTAYKIIVTDGMYADEVPFEERALNPATTYVVYENNISDRPLAGITYYTLLNEEGEVEGTKVYVYTSFGLYEARVDTDGILVSADDIVFTPYDVGGVPIIEYPNNQWRLGDWELCMGLMDAINNLNSGRLDDIDQVVQSLLVFINADIDSDTYDEMRERGVVILKNMTGNQSDVRTVQNSLDQSGMHLFAEEMEQLLYALIGIPDRSGRQGGGGDTGQAVELRDGWADLEVIARNKELVFKKAEKQALKVILKIMSNTLGTDLSLLDVDIKFTRNKNNNLLVKTQAYANLLATKTLTPADCLTIVDLVSDVNEFVARGEDFWKENFAGQIPPQLEQAQNPNQQGDNLPADNKTANKSKEAGKPTEKQPVQK